MFPVVRLAKEVIRAKRMPRLSHATDSHVSHHICWPWDLDMFLELNNGRALTLLDIGRIGMAQRAGLVEVLRRERWGLTMAGSSVRYRHRIKGLERFRVESRVIGWDGKFTYIEQASIKTDGRCANHALYRAAVTDKNGLITPATVLEAIGEDSVSPPLPDWVKNWCAAEATRPWPPMSETCNPTSAAAS